MNTREVVCSIALSRLRGLGLLNARVLVDALGSAEAVFDHRHELLAHVPDARPRLLNAFAHADEALGEAERELEFVLSKHLKVYTLTEDDYPQRLKECPDAPLALFGCGTADLNAQRIVSVVGTRRCSEYGREVCRNFVADLSRRCPDVVVVSGLAYGIDICAHRAALDHGLSTVGILAHGLDTIYPSMHRGTAAEMVQGNGGLLTEYGCGTVPEKGNFVRRNRIVAGLCDACVVVESLAKGGSLITAEAAMAYNRDVFAFPGRVYDENSGGCNKLIRDNRASLILCAEDLLHAMGWPDVLENKSEKRTAQQDLFVELSDEEKTVAEVLKSVDDMHVNQLSVCTNIPYSRLVTLLFDMEVKGLLKVLGGARYRLVHK